MFKFRLDKNLIKVATAAIIFSLLYSTFFRQLPLLNILSLKTKDIFAQLSYRLKPKPSQLKEIVIVAIDDASFEKMNLKWPWPRSVFANFIQNLIDYEPKIISLDLVFLGESQNKDDDILLEQAIKKAGNVILSSFVGSDGEYKKILDSFLKVALDCGIINKPRDKDLVVRKSRLKSLVDPKLGVFDYSFGLKTFLHFSDIDIDKDALLKDKTLFIPAPFADKRKNKGEMTPLIKFDNYGVVDLNFQANLSDFEVVHFYEIIDKTVPKEKISGKLVMVGQTAEIFHDVYPTPLGVMPGIIINANETLMYLSGKPEKKIPNLLQSFIILFLAIFSSFLTLKLTPLKGFFSFLVLFVLIFFISLTFSYKNITFDYFGFFFIVAITFLGTQGYKYGRLFIEATLLKTMAITDGLTGLYVHRYLMLKLESEFNRCQEENSQLSFLIMDIDHFKNINDTYGHEEGNVILKHIAKIIQDNSRKVDVLARYGGEEFCVILPGATEKGANIYAERLKKSIEEFNFPYQESKSLKVTISIGIASLKQTNALTPQELIAFADKALYQAKETGRNKVCTFIPPQTNTATQ